MDLLRAVRSVANLVNLSTPFGLALAVAGRGKLRRCGHLVVAEQVKLPLITASAMTVGCVVLVPNVTLAEAQRNIPTLLAHEDEHAWQWAYCLGLPFLPLYGAAMLWSMVRSGDRATANHVEVQAGLLTGGYQPGEKRPVREGLRLLMKRPA